MIHDEINIAKFFAAIEPNEDAYENDSFAYVCIKRGSEFAIVQARLFMNVGPVVTPEPFISHSVKAGHFKLSEAGLTRKTLVSALLAGELDTPHGKFVFLPNGAGYYGSRYEGFHADGLKSYSRFPHLTLFGGETRDLIVQPDLDWELRAAEVPYDGLQDLLATFRPGLPSDICKVEVVGFNAAAVDVRSRLDGTIATVLLKTPKNIDRGKLSLSYRVTANGAVAARSKISARDFEWTDEGDFKVGVMQFSVPAQSVVQCIAVYNDVAQHYLSILDLKRMANARRVSYEAFDPGLALFDEVLNRAQSVKPDSREFEAVIPWLFWMLGFSPAALSNSHKLTNAPDGLLSTPAGDLVVLECTVGILREDSKLSRLHDRVEAVKKSLENSNLSFNRVLPVLVTAKTQAEVQPDLEVAAKQGVLVITREALDRLKEETYFIPDANLRFDEAFRIVSEAANNTLSA